MVKRTVSANKSIDMYAVYVFVTMAEAGSMTAAATRLGLTPSAISQTIRLLEEDFGVKLVNRARRPFVLTPYGIALKNRGEILTEEIANLKAQVLEAGKGIKPDLRIGLVDSFAITCGSVFTKSLMKSSSQLLIRTGLSPQQGEALMRRELDLIVTSDPLIDSDSVVRHQLFSEGYFIITPPDYRKRIKTVEDIRELSSALPLVRFNRNSQIGMQIERYLRRIDIRVPNMLEFDNADTLTSMVAAGIGWAVTTPLSFLQSVAHSREVLTHMPEQLNIKRSLYIVGHRDEYSAFFEEACDVTHDIIKTVFIPKLKTLNRGIEKLVEINPDNTE
ncbi:LysR family transcriptional regulator [Pectobacterium polaris]|jgi:DNA-binding transcriptional LysR family regulator|uniref:LysR family transcriptional regulator n=1 Tax=Pectobacterium polaris TaxID=2042057 RepID=A0AAP9BL94_9GAMM|nr:LysR family transcriptional regulator [Pectobacterium polaris]ASY81957.1 LysR family transcriptional regulator [Pectobacterium polaris]MBN3216846.1 LysR family transcriptional regulator [Pectobacterium polaris]MCA6940006.1 LysR family transcriptional regulator [Pectobacterium polaris]MCA6954697.1 LysR family transcriptional regulator [Pectobacterium polaris]MCA6958717.1 LysR family transcriptional regulator [Pectobacterium polaris]